MAIIVTKIVATNIHAISPLLGVGATTADASMVEGATARAGVAALAGLMLDTETAGFEFALEDGAVSAAAVAWLSVDKLADAKLGIATAAAKKNAKHAFNNVFMMRSLKVLRCRFHRYECG